MNNFDQNLIPQRGYTSFTSCSSRLINVFLHSSKALCHQLRVRIFFNYTCICGTFIFDFWAWYLHAANKHKNECQPCGRPLLFGPVGDATSIASCHINSIIFYITQLAHKPGEKAPCCYHYCWQYTCSIIVYASLFVVYYSAHTHVCSLI